MHKRVGSFNSNLILEDLSSDTHPYISLCMQGEKNLFLTSVPFIVSHHPTALLIHPPPLTVRSLVIIPALLFSGKAQ